MMLANAVADAMATAGVTHVPSVRDLDPGGVPTPELRIPLSQYADLWAAAYRERPEPMLGVELASHVSLEAFDALGYFVKVAPTLGDSLRRLARHCGILSDGATCRLETDVERARFEIESLVGLQCPSHSVDFMLALLAATIARQVGHAVTLLEVRFGYAKPAHAAQLAEFFRAPLVFGAPAHGLVFDARLLASPCPARDPQLSKVLERQVRMWVTASGPADSLLYQVQQAIESRLPDSSIGARDVASDLAMSERTLRRRLSEAGASYQGVLDEVRFRLARRHLRTTSMDIGEIAHQLGFSDASGFTRAFRRWAGGTAMEFRRRST